jgi:hypothetical protein
MFYNNQFEKIHVGGVVESCMLHDMENACEGERIRNRFKNVGYPVES